MTAICLRLGNPSSIGEDKSMSDARVINATTAEEIMASRKDVTQSSLDQLDVVVSGSDLVGLYNPMELANWVPLLRTDASVSIKVVGEANDLNPVHTSFLLAGLSSASERKEADGSRVLTATRKPKAAVSAAPLKKKVTNNNAVTISLDDGFGDDGDDDMIDEDNLLSDDVLAPPPAMGARTAADDDCAGRKPCDNCTCGRADQEASGNASEQQNAPSSSCGKCHLGDAFRCASCPYLGKPAFKAGEEHVVLQLDDDL